MSQQRNALKAGIFILVSIALIFVVVVAIQGIGGFLESMQVRAVTFTLKDDVGGLRPGDDVRIGGFKVGTVRKIEVDNLAAEPAIVVTFILPKKYELRQDAVVAIQSTVTGQSWLNFENLGRTGVVLGPDDKLRGLPSGLTVAMNTLRNVAPKIDQSVDEVRQIVGDVRNKTVPLVNETIAQYGKTADTFTQTGQSGAKFIEELRGQLKPVIDKYHVVADSTVKMMDEVRDVFGATKGDFRETMANLKGATGTMKQKLPGLIEKVEGVMQKIDTTVSSANAAMEDARKTLETAKLVMTGNKSKLDGMIASLKATSDNLKGASAEIRRSPWRLLYKPGSGEMANLNLFDSARAFAEGANDLDNAAQALRDALKQDKANPETVRKLMGQLEEEFAKFKTVEQKLWTEVKE